MTPPKPGIPTHYTSPDHLAANYDEALAGSLPIPDLLTCADGTVVTDAQQWLNKRRPELLALFAREMYGKTLAPRPVPTVQMHGSALPVLNGLGHLRQLTLRYGEALDQAAHLMLILPTEATQAVPVFITLNFGGNQEVANWPTIRIPTGWFPNNAQNDYPDNRATDASRGINARRWPLESILRRGYAIATAYYGDFDPDFDDGFRNGVHPLGNSGQPLTNDTHSFNNDSGDTRPFSSDGTHSPSGDDTRSFSSDNRDTQSPSSDNDNATRPYNNDSDGAHRADYPANDEWGAIGAWAWGMSLIADYLLTLPQVDATRLIALGHSRLGKAALWAGAQDERFAIVIANNSGCGGAALSRRNFGESLARINRVFPHWFCRNFHKYGGNEAALPFDQHALIALMAPRPVYIASATEDLWADPYGEFLAARAASPAYALFGKRGLDLNEPPPPDQSVGDAIGTHRRSGKHDILRFDWERYMDFADRHFSNGS